MQGIRDDNEAATLLANGAALLVGGHDGGEGNDPASTGAELYDPSTGRWTETGSTSSARRSGHTLTRLLDGRVLVAGGSAYQTPGAAPYAQASAELYDPGTGRWTKTGSMTTPRSGHIATLLPDGSVLVVGGYLPNLATTRRAETFDPGTGTWASAGSTTAVRAARGAALLADGRVLVVGSGDGAGAGFRAETYDPTTRKWTGLATSGGPDCFSRMVRLADGRILVICGSVFDPDTLSATLFDPTQDSWAPTGAPVRRFADVALLADGRVLLADVGAGEVYDPATGTWTTAGLPTYSGSGPSQFRITGDTNGPWYEVDTSTVLLDGRVLMTIGPAAFLYDPSGTP
jgi:N-acetylneuraminic acid mutarotase